MRIRELFQNDVTRPIAPVVYFHEDDPAKLRTEVREYIITGGYLEGDPRARRAKSGIAASSSAFESATSRTCPSQLSMRPSGRPCIAARTPPQP